MSKRWNHKVVEITYKFFAGKLNDRLQLELDKMSAQGWELVAISDSRLDYSLRLFFKREA